MFKFREIVTRTVRETIIVDGGDEIDNVIGTEQVEIVGIGEPGQVKVRPLNSDAEFFVSIKRLSKVA